MIKVNIAFSFAILICSTSVLAQKLEISKIKYPNAIVFEGGKGIRSFIDNQIKYLPTWRLYLCLSKTTQATSGQYVLDLSKLDTPYIETYEDFSRRLNKVVLNYTYESELIDMYLDKHGLAFGESNITVESQQDWEYMYIDPKLNDKLNTFYDIKLFDIYVSKSNFFSNKNYMSNEEWYYMSSFALRFKYNEKENKTVLIDACENANQPFVLQIGNEITPIQ